jgi:hypothetical protein
MLHTEGGLFFSALVIGLYVLMIPSHPEQQDADSDGFELMDDVDWKSAGYEGFQESSTSGAEAENPVRKFIRDGGPMCFGGALVTGGFQSARRLIMEYAGVLEEVAKWMPEEYHQILHIISDVMFEDEEYGNDIRPT